ncbi:MAG: 4-hydroxy-tetrahydrodipicolinate synthase [Candidatus Thioglobus sp.]|nr:4-hydroxy-tetrahydrodipicolinate synthase [Candidatus Thioglobus sp.]
MQAKNPLTGAMVALITPMFDDGSLDFDSLKNLVEFHINEGSSGIVSMGTTGESATLNQAEHIEVMQKTVEFARGKIPIIAGTGANSTAEAIELTLAAKDIGAAAALLVTPYYNKPTQEGLYQHYKAVAEAVEIEQILYNVPSRTAVDLSVETAVRLAGIDNIIGIKDATGDLSVGKELIAKCPPGFMFYSGDDGTAIEFILLGGHGGISVSSNISPKLVSQAYNAALAGDGDLAHSIDAKLRGLHQNLFIESNPIPVKWALYKMNKCEAGMRLPLTKLSGEAQIILEQDLLSLGVV